MPAIIESEVLDLKTPEGQKYSAAKKRNAIAMTDVTMAFQSERRQLKDNAEDDLVAHM
jgi:hypothetical protein